MISSYRILQLRVRRDSDIPCSRVLLIDYLAFVIDNKSYSSDLFILEIDLYGLRLSILHKTALKAHFVFYFYIAFCTWLQKYLTNGSIWLLHTWILSYIEIWVYHSNLHDFLYNVLLTFCFHSYCLFSYAAMMHQQATYVPRAVLQCGS